MMTADDGLSGPMDEDDIAFGLAQGRVKTGTLGWGRLEGMEPVHEPARERTRSVDVTGLPEEAIRAVELLISQLRGPQEPVPQGGVASFSSYEEWSKALHEWAKSHKPLDTQADYSRESIYPDRA